MKSIESIKGNVVDVINKKIFTAEVQITNGKIRAITPINESCSTFLIPGFIDSHVHVESSMLVPTEFARIAVTHGTIGTISDPHEIANVLGIPGVELMLENAKHSPFYFNFGAPSCVPATQFETAGANITAKDIDELLKRPEIRYLSEMMNFPGVIYQDQEVLAKLEVAKKHKKPIDGHAPGLMGADMPKYFDAGISTDHECFLYDEALAKLQHGVKIMIREGSAAKNFETLIPLLKEFPNQIMFCCDDKHPNNLIESHINDHVKRAVAAGNDIFDVLRAATYNTIQHYNLPIGCLQVGDSADFIEVADLIAFPVLKTIIKGQIVSENGNSYLEKVDAPILNQFNTDYKTVNDFAVNHTNKTVRVIEALDGQLITKELHLNVNDEDVLKFAVINRYQNAPVSVGFIKNFGLKAGAIAGSVAHDCHNIVAVGTNDEDLARAVNLIIEQKGGISLVCGDEEHILPLPIAGIMTNDTAENVAESYVRMDTRAKELGSKLRSPYMTLSFMALLVIPELKLSDLGLFDGKKFEFVSLDVEEKKFKGVI